MSASRRINGIAAFAAAAAPATAVLSGLRAVDPAAPKSLSDQRRGGRSGPSAVDAFCGRSRDGPGLLSGRSFKPKPRKRNKCRRRFGTARKGRRLKAVALC